MTPDVFLLRLPLQGIYTTERVWAQRMTSAHARILSVVRYEAEAQCMDIVRYKGDDYDGMVLKSTLTMHRVYGGPTAPAEAMALTEQLRQQGLQIEVWSMTMAAGNTDPVPLRGGLMVAHPHAAVAALAGRPLYYPTLLAAVGDELGARRHAKGAV